VGGSASGAGTIRTDLPLFTVGKANHIEVPSTKVNTWFCCILTGCSIIPQFVLSNLLAFLFDKAFKVISPDLKSPWTNEIVVFVIKEPNQVLVAGSISTRSTEVNIVLHTCMTGPSFHAM
jgi:hypothetical protein